MCSRTDPVYVFSEVHMEETDKLPLATLFPTIIQHVLRSGCETRLKANCPALKKQKQNTADEKG